MREILKFKKQTFDKTELYTIADCVRESQQELECKFNFRAAKEPPLCAKFEIQNFSSKTLTTFVPKTGAEQQGSLKVVHSGT